VHPAIALWDSWVPSWHKFFLSPIPHSVSNERFPCSCSIHQQSFWLLIFDQIEEVLLPVLCCHLFIFNNGSVFRKHFMLAKGLCSWHCITSKGLLELSMSFDGTVTEFNTHKWWHTSARYSVLPFPWRVSQTPPDMSSTYSTLRHCTAMPLQMGM
jgi:hypothetical protein